MEESEKTKAREVVKKKSFEKRTKYETRKEKAGKAKKHREHHVKQHDKKIKTKHEEKKGKKTKRKERKVKSHNKVKKTKEHATKSKEKEKKHVLKEHRATVDALRRKKELETKEVEKREKSSAEVLGTNAFC